MNERFYIGNRVIISEKYHWAKNAIGEIVPPPNYIVEISAGWGSNFREVQSLDGKRLFYWIKFDVPQIDTTGNDLYHEAEISSNYLKLIE